MENDSSILRVENLKMYYSSKRSLFSSSKQIVKAVDGISFEIEKGKTYGLVGESGCGKTTTGKCILRILKPTSGSIYFKGEDITKMDRYSFMKYRRKIQLIFQDPYGSLDPRQSIGSIVAEAVCEPGKRIINNRGEINSKVKELLALVEINPDLSNRYPHELSGGQRQRLGIARALACNPELIVCDEPVSALDVSIQAQIINLFKKLQRQLGLSYLFIAHDLAVVQHIADRIGIMYLGHLVEEMNSGELHEKAIHPYTKALLSAVPTTDYYSEIRRNREVLPGEVPSPIDVPSGCPFNPRCKFADEQCRSANPKMVNTMDGHFVSCHKFSR